MANLPDSSTFLLGLFGHPVAHSISPQIHNAAFRAAGLNWLYLAFAVEPKELRKALQGCRALKIVGLNITVPHKETIVPLLDELSEEVRLIGAVNTVCFEEGRAKGYNTDGRGFVAALQEEKDFNLAGKNMFIIGAGGAGRAVAVQAAREGASRVIIADLKLEKAEDLSRWINSKIKNEPASTVEIESSGWKKALEESDLVVDATPLGLKNSDPTAFDTEMLSPSALVVDLVYNPPETALLNQVKRLGIAGMSGLGMLVHQAALAWEIWTGRPAPLKVMKEAASAALCKIKNAQGDS